MTYQPVHESPPRRPRQVVLARRQSRLGSLVLSEAPAEVGDDEALPVLFKVSDRGRECARLKACVRTPLCVYDIICGCLFNVFQRVRAGPWLPARRLCGFGARVWMGWGGPRRVVPTVP